MFANKIGSLENVGCGLCWIFEPKNAETQLCPIPLVAVDIVASVIHAVTQVQVTQVFVNKEKKKIKAIYYFPIDFNEAVTHFEAEIGGRKIKGILKINEDAQEVYENTIRMEEKAYFGENDEADTFKVTLGFLKPKHQAKVIIGYTSEVKKDKGSNAIRFFIPNTVVPLYEPQRGTDERSKHLKKITVSSPAHLSIKVNVSIQGEIKSIESPTHQITVRNQGPVPKKPNWTKAVVDLAGKTTDMDRDFVVLITPEDTQKPRLYLEKMENSVAIMAHLTPSFKLNEQNAELIFFVDCCPMYGLGVAKPALMLLLNSLPANCYFNIVRFGSSYQILFPKSVKYDDDNLKKAVAHTKELQEEEDSDRAFILEPLKEIFNTELITGYLRQIFILTHGETPNAEEVIGIIKAKAHECRVFALGIGDDPVIPLHCFVDGIVQVGGGTSAYVTYDYDETVDMKVLQQLKVALQPSLTNVRLTWNGVTLPQEKVARPQASINKEKTLIDHGKLVSPKAVEAFSGTTTDTVPVRKLYRQAPEKIPPISVESQLVVFGVFDNPNEKPTSAVITADSPDGPLSIEIQLTDSTDAGKTGMIHKLAAIRIIREIEMKVDCDSWGEDNNTEGKSREAIHKAEIIELALKEGIPSKYTSFVAVDTSTNDKTRTPDNWTIQRHLVPSHGYRKHRRMDAYIDETWFQRRCPSAARRIALMVKRWKKFVRSRAGIPLESPTSSDELLSDSWEDLKKTGNSEGILQKVLYFQRDDGSFLWDGFFIKFLGYKTKVYYKDAKKNKWNLRPWATALTLAFLSAKLADQKESWDPAANKAKKYLAENYWGQRNAMLELAKQRIQET